MQVLGILALKNHVTASDVSVAWGGLQILDGSKSVDTLLLRTSIPREQLQYPCQ